MEFVGEVSVDVLIVGSGPVGATFARQLVEGNPEKRILMVDLGTQLSKKPGTNAKNFYLYNYNEDGLDALSEIVKGELILTSEPIQDLWPETLDPVSQPPVPPVRYRINRGNPDQQDWENMPAGASSFNVGGMGAHWTCCTPRPTPAEQIPFIDPREWDVLVTRGEALMRTTQEAFDKSLRGQVIRERLAEVFDEHLPDDRQVQMLPLACHRVNPQWVEWTGVDTILGALAEDGAIPKERFELWPENICRKLNVEGGRVTSAEIEHLPTGEKRKVVADIVVVAANTLYTPQLLWTSGIRPEALGHYLNDQPMVFGQIVLKHELLEKIAERWTPPPPSVDPIPIPHNDPIPNVWMPFSDPEHPFHCQIHRDAFPYGSLTSDLGVDHRTIVGLRWFSRQEVRRENHITFSDKYRDLYGMPQITFHHTLSEADRQTVNAALNDMAKAAESLGGYLPSEPPQVLPRGSSLHYMGTFRMGDPENPDHLSESVCDPYSKVWNMDNLYLGGNGIIPSSMACNPTLSSVALALRACDRILETWK